MKRLFTLAIIAMIASLTFAQAPVQKMKASDKKVEKVASATQMSKAMEAKAAFDAKAQAAQETSSSVLRKAAHRPTMAMGQQVKAQKMVPNAQVSRMAKPAKTKSTVNARLNDAHKVAPTAKKAVAKGDANDGYIDVVADSYTKTYFATGDWYYELTAGAYTFVFDIYADPAPLNGTYTWDTMDDYYSYAKYLNYYYDDYSDATFTINAEGEIDAYCTLLNTGEMYHITYTAPEATDITSEETWVFTPETSTDCELLDLTANSGIFQLYGANPDGKLAGITITSDHVAGTYGFDDIYALGYYTNIYLSEDDYEGIKCYDMNATVTETSAQVDYYGVNGVLYHLNFTFAAGGDEPADVTVTKDNNGIITSVEGGVQKTYTRSADGTVYYASSGSVYIGEQSGTVTVVEDGEKVYIKDPIARFAQNSWVEGTKNGNMVVVPCGQPLTYNSQWDATISLRYGVITADGSIGAADDYAENVIYTVNGDTWTLQNTAAYGNTDGDAYFVGAMWDDDDSFAGGEAETVLTYDPTYVAPSTDLVVLPTGAEVQDWTLNGTSVTSTSSSPVMNQPVKVAFVGNDVYVQGIFDAFPTAWVKGTKSGSTVTFANLQYIGNYGGSYDMYFAGTDGEGLTNATATLSADAQTLSFNESLLANAATDRIYYLTWLDNVVISGVPAEEPVITDLTATLPYVNGFDTDAEKAEAAIYDANGDGKTWTFANDTKSGSDAARYTYNSSKTGDDYVVFPGLSLKAGTSYKVSVDARPYGSTYPERIEVVAGTVAKASELTTVVIEPTDLATGDYETLNGEFTPEADGVYYFALHAISDADMFYLYADNFAVKENNPNTPAAPANLVVTADPEAALKATVSFNAPELTVSGAEIEDDVVVTLSRNAEVLKSYSVPAGSPLKYIDKSMTEPGFYTYSVVASVGELVSDAVTAKAYIGEDQPDDVENLVGFDVNGKVALSWDAPADGINGGIIIPENLQYNVYPVEMVEFFGMQFPAIDFENPYATAITETNAEVDFDTNSGAQGYTYFGVTAENTAGESNGAMAAVLTGAPYELPFVETFPNGNLSYWWGVDYDDNIYNADGGLGITTEGELVFDAPCEGWIELMSGKIALDGAENPALSFSYKTDAAATLQVKVITPEDEEIVGLMPVENTEWATAQIDLGFYADQPWVRFNIVGNFEEATQLYVDNLIVMDMVQNDLQIAVSAPKTVTAGKAAVVKATVKNVGQATAEDYQVKFYVNDVEAPAPMFETPALAFMETAEFEFELETSIFDEAGDVVVKAEVVFGADEKDADNADECVVTVVAPSAAPVESVVAEQTTEGVVVSWTVAENSAAETTEDFESFEGNTIYADGESCGPWAAADLAPGDSYYWNSDAIMWPHWDTPYAFGIMNFEMSGLTESFAAVSGDQAVLFMSNTTAANKYMISPELPGVAQTVSFMACPITAQYGAETFEVLASSTDANPASFTKVASFSTDTEDWLEFSALLPEGTKYFAIHYTSNDIFGLFIDNLTYTAGGANPTGFNVYVDENLVAALDAEARSYTYAEEISEGDHDFSVTAVYGSSESAPATVTLGVATGIQNINAASNVEVYTLDGIRINNVKNLKAGVYVVNGKKLVIK